MGDADCEREIEGIGKTESGGVCTSGKLMAPIP